MTWRGQCLGFSSFPNMQTHPIPCVSLLISCADKSKLQSYLVLTFFRGPNLGFKYKFGPCSCRELCKCHTMSLLWAVNKSGQLHCGRLQYWFWVSFMTVFLSKNRCASLSSERESCFLQHSVKLSSLNMIYGLAAGLPSLTEKALILLSGTISPFSWFM